MKDYQVEIAAAYERINELESTLAAVRNTLVSGETAEDFDVCLGEIDHALDPDLVLA